LPEWHSFGPGGYAESLAQPVEVGARHRSASGADEPSRRRHRDL